MIEHETQAFPPDKDRHSLPGLSIFSQMLHGLALPMYSTDATGLITMCNSAAIALWGREPVVGEDRWCGAAGLCTADGFQISPEHSPCAICISQQQSINGTQVQIARPGGEVRIVEHYSQPLFNAAGELTGTVNILVDTTESRRKEEELLKSEDRYHKMIEEVEDYAIILLDENGLIRNWNKGAEKINGYKEEDIVGSSFERFYSKTDQEEGVPRRLLAEAREKGKATAEGWRIRKDGSRFWGSILITALHDKAGKVAGFSKVTRDLTERKYAEDKLREYSNELEFQNKELEQFVYAASHDMKEPLRKIHLYNSYVAERSADKLDAKSADYLKRSVAAARRMNELIEDLLAYSRTSPGTESFEQIEINLLLDELWDQHHEEIEAAQARLVRNNIKPITGIPFQCKQLLDNIINNALKYRCPGRPLEIVVSSAMVRDVQAEVDNIEKGMVYHRLTISDNGMGFEDVYAKKIFEIFQRLSSSPAIKGSGIGLAICKKIMQNHKGFITASGTPGVGARFDLYFPQNR